MRMKLEYLVTKETHPDHDKDYNGPKDSLCWSEAWDLLHKVEAINSHIQRGEDPILPLWPLGLVCHPRDMMQPWERCEV